MKKCEKGTHERRERERERELDEPLYVCHPCSLCLHKMDGWGVKLAHPSHGPLSIVLLCLMQTDKAG